MFVICCERKRKGVARNLRGIISSFPNHYQCCFLLTPLGILISLPSSFLNTLLLPAAGPLWACCSAWNALTTVSLPPLSLCNPSSSFRSQLRGWFFEREAFLFDASVRSYWGNVTALILRCNHAHGYLVCPLVVSLIHGKQSVTIY